MSVQKSQAVPSLLSVTIRVACPNGHVLGLDRECLVVDSGNCDSPTVTAEWSCVDCAADQAEAGVRKGVKARIRASYSVTVYGL